MEKEYWYKKTTYSCPLCGSEENYKAREYTKKPTNWEDRNIFKEVFDYCNV